MNRYVLAVVLGVSALATGAALMIFADRQGWLPGRDGATVVVDEMPSLKSAATAALTTWRKLCARGAVQF